MSAVRRRSGRIHSSQQRAPSEDEDAPQVSNNNAKRKRKSVRGGQGDASEDSTSSESTNEEEEDEDEYGASRQRLTKAKSTPTKKPASKKTKTTSGETKSLPVRPAANGSNAAASKPKSVSQKKSRADVDRGSDEDEGSLFDKVRSGLHPDQLASEWVNSYNEGGTAAMRDLVNFVLRCAGCEFEVNVHDIEDPDNAPNKLEDLQDQYHGQKISDYPLIAKGKGTAALRAHITDFFRSLVATTDTTNILHNEPAVMENFQIWLTSMTDSTLRPFRHTATLISLAMGSTLCDLAAEYGKTMATFMRQRDAEAKSKKKVNEARINSMDVKIKDIEDRKEEIQSLIIDSVFDTVFVHRYRDVEPKIRLECASVLGTWIATFPEVFFTGHYIRYYGWLLSDPSGMVRAEVLKQLSKLYKLDNAVSNLRAFTERFRPRMLEMAARDAEPHIRAGSIELLGQLRQLGLLEPDDIDSIGRLIFDVDVRVRKAVTPFIRQSIDDLKDSIIEELGGDELIDDALGEDADDDFERPRKSWFDYKSLTETLQACETEDDPGLAAQEVSTALSTKHPVSRHTLAAQALADGFGDSNHWEALAGYLLCDLSNLEGITNETEKAIKERCALTEKEQLLLLEYLHVSIKARILLAVSSEVDKKGKRSKVRTAESRETQEHTALHLFRIIPKLLQKYSSDSSTTAAILRLGQVLNLEVFQAMRQDSSAYGALLDDINKQFITHTDQSVLTEATGALLHARTFDDFEEITDEKIEELWNAAIDSFRKSLRASRTALVDSLRRIHSLASISDCANILESERADTVRKTKHKSSDQPIVTILEQLILGAASQDVHVQGGDDAADLIASLAMKTLLLYHMWTVRSRQGTSVTNGATLLLSQFPSSFADALLRIIAKRRPFTSTLCLVASETYLDLYTLFATYRSSSSKTASTAQIEHIPAEAHPLLFRVINSSLILFARKLGRSLSLDLEADPAFEDNEDHAPISDDDDDDDNEDADDEEPSEDKKAALLVAEKNLCELAGKSVLAIVARVLDQEGDYKGKIRHLLIRNKTNLGPNFKEVVTYLESPKKGKIKSKATSKKPPVRKQPETVELDDDPIDDEDDLGQDEQDDEIDGEVNGVNEGVEDDEVDGAGAGAQENGVEDDIMGD